MGIPSQTTKHVSHCGFIPTTSTGAPKRNYWLPSLHRTLMQYPQCLGPHFISIDPWKTKTCGFPDVSRGSYWVAVWQPEDPTSQLSIWIVPHRQDHNAPWSIVHFHWAALLSGGAGHRHRNRIGDIRYYYIYIIYLGYDMIVMWLLSTKTIPGMQPQGVKYL
jgi:hypothetical protein